MRKGRKYTGAKYHSDAKRKKFERIGQENIATLGNPKRKQKKGMGSTVKVILLNSNEANVTTPKGTKKSKILNVVETPQNVFLARQNRLMKGSIIETEEGKARITNRPPREGFVNAVLIN